MTRVRKAAPATEAVSAEAPAEGVQPFALGREDVHPAAGLSGLERIGERFAKRVRAVIEPLTQAKTQVTANPLESQRFESWQARLPDFLSLSFYRLRPLKGGMLLVIEPDFIARLVDIFYGGTGEVRPNRAKEFTPSEERLAARLADGIVERLVEAWAEVATLAPALAARETNAGYANLFRPDEMLVVQRFTITPVQGKPTAISIAYPLAALRAVDSQLTAKVHDDQGPADAAWRSRMAYALEQVHLPVRSVLARSELSLAQIMNLKPGDVIPVSLPPKVPLLVASKRVAMGTIGEKNGHAALMVEHIEKGAFE